MGATNFNFSFKIAIIPIRIPGYIFPPVMHVHKSGMPSFAHSRRGAETISSSLLLTNCHPQPLTGVLICWRERGDFVGGDRTGDNLLAGTISGGGEMKVGPGWVGGREGP